MNLVFDVGNTETVLGLFEAGTLQEHWRISTWPERTVDEAGLLVRSLVRESGFDLELVTGSTIASVVPPLTPVLTEMCERHLGVRTLVIDARSALPIRLDVEEPNTVGADRIVNTLAAARLYRTDTIAVDLGTATTFDCITRDGVFCGGVIAPGVHTGAESLVRRTSKLPRVDLEPPQNVIGRRTETAIRSGIFFGAVDAIDGIVRRIKEEWRRPDALVVATGGLATLIAPHCATVDRIEPFLTLYGLDLAFQHLLPSRERLVPLKVPAARRR
ncbi:MAG TPA: type III pantothenate kinase [Longimicrobiales bacterium]|nr:type III pantothenate kinase [Longimicrobiales bacterium]